MVGIGGIGMSGIAEILLDSGFEVTGSDRQLSDITDRLNKLGATIYKGHYAKNLDQADVVVYSSAVHLDNPELTAAAEKKKLSIGALGTTMDMDVITLLYSIPGWA